MKNTFVILAAVAICSSTLLLLSSTNKNVKTIEVKEQNPAPVLPKENKKPDISSFSEVRTPSRPEVDQAIANPKGNLEQRLAYWRGEFAKFKAEKRMGTPDDYYRLSGWKSDEEIRALVTDKAVEILEEVTNECEEHWNSLTWGEDSHTKALVKMESWHHQDWEVRDQYEWTDCVGDNALVPLDAFREADDLRRTFGPGPAHHYKGQELTKGGVNIPPEYLLQHFTKNTQMNFSNETLGKADSYRRETLHKLADLRRTWTWPMECTASVAPERMGLYPVSDPQWTPGFHENQAAQAAILNEYFSNIQSLL